MLSWWKSLEDFYLYIFFDFSFIHFFFIHSYLTKVFMSLGCHKEADGFNGISPSWHLTISVVSGCLLFLSSASVLNSISRKKEWSALNSLPFFCLIIFIYFFLTFFFNLIYWHVSVFFFVGCLIVISCGLCFASGYRGISAVDFISFYFLTCITYCRMLSCHKWGEGHRSEEQVRRKKKRETIKDRREEKRVIMKDWEVVRKERQWKKCRREKRSKNREKKERGTMRNGREKEKKRIICNDVKRKYYKNWFKEERTKKRNDRTNDKPCEFFCLLIYFFFHLLLRWNCCISVPNLGSKYHFLIYLIKMKMYYLNVCISKYIIQK